MKAQMPDDYKKGKWFFLCVRHSGCTFCREELFNFKDYEEKVVALGFQPVVVHLGPEASGAELQKKYELSKTKFISDSKKFWFKLFGFPRGSLNQVLGPKNIKQGLLGGSLFKFGIGKLEGDGFQLGGAAQIVDGKFQILHKAEYAGDLGDYSELIEKMSKV